MHLRPGVLAALAAVVVSPGAAQAASGQLYSFGWNEYGQLGTATNSGMNTANPVPSAVSLPGVSGPVNEIAAGDEHSLVLTATGQLYAFGYNDYGELGNATGNGNLLDANPTPTPVSLPGATGQPARIAAGTGFSLVLTSTGQVYSFGDNHFGQLGISMNSGGSNPNPTPALVSLPGASGPAVAIAAGQQHSLVLTVTGQLFAFGDNYSGQLGNTTDNGTHSAHPAAVQVTLPGATGPITQIAAGRWSSFAVTSTGQLFAFGDNYSGELGDANNNCAGTANPTPAVVTLPGATGGVTQVEGGYDHTLATTSTGQLYAFGDNALGELGNATNNPTCNANPTPTLVALPGPAVAIAAGNEDSLALTAAGQLYAFGDNFYGELGNATNNGMNTPNPTPTLVPITVPAGELIDAISVGPIAYHTLVALAPLPPPPPVVSALRVTPRTVSVAGRRVKGHCVKPTHKNRMRKRCLQTVKLTIGYSLNVAAGVTFTIELNRTWRRVKGRCVKQTKKNKAKPRCTLVTPVRGSLAQAGVAGSNSFTWNGVIAHHRLGPGRYVLTATPAGGTPQMTTFKLAG